MVVCNVIVNTLRCDRVCCFSVEFVVGNNNIWDFDVGKALSVNKSIGFFLLNLDHIWYKILL